MNLFFILFIKFFYLFSVLFLYSDLGASSVSLTVGLTENLGAFFLVVDLYYYFDFLGEGLASVLN